LLLRAPGGRGLVGLVLVCPHCGAKFIVPGERVEGVPGPEPPSPPTDHSGGLGPDRRAPPGAGTIGRTGDTALSAARRRRDGLSRHRPGVEPACRSYRPRDTRRSDMIRLVQISGARPEQYDAYFGDRYVGQLRLRDGCFLVECPRGTVVYEARPRGDGFFDPEERHQYLNAACAAILAALPKQK